MRHIAWLCGCGNGWKCGPWEPLSLVLIKQNTVSSKKDDNFTTFKKNNTYTYQTQNFIFSYLKIYY